jgi:PRTRC genetic system ThiF family protein
MNKPKIHFADKYLMQPTNPISVNLIGAGGTGSQVLTALARINHSLNALQHAGLSVRVFDDDIVTEANRGRQLFTSAELGLNKGVALINRINRFFGTNWKALPTKFDKDTFTYHPEYTANITISCVDSVAARFDIAHVLKGLENNTDLNKALYWMDFGNSRYTGQVVLSTVHSIKQPASKKYQPVHTLPFVTDEFRTLLQQADKDDTPSCSLAEALTKQDLFINSSLADLGASLLWQLFREGMTENRGFFHNIKEFRTQALKVA